MKPIDRIHALNAARWSRVLKAEDCPYKRLSGSFVLKDENGSEICNLRNVNIDTSDIIGDIFELQNFITFLISKNIIPNTVKPTMAVMKIQNWDWKCENMLQPYMFQTLADVQAHDVSVLKSQVSNVLSFQTKKAS